MRQKKGNGVVHLQEHMNGVCVCVWACFYILVGTKYPHKDTNSSYFDLVGTFVWCPWLKLGCCFFFN